MKIQHINSIFDSEIIDVSEPNYGRHDLGGNHYGHLLVTHDKRILYFYNTENECDFEDVTSEYRILE